jgi:hypothetical protein
MRPSRLDQGPAFLLIRGYMVALGGLEPPALRVLSEIGG